MSRLIYILSFLLYFSHSVFAGNPENHKKTFVEKDIFQSSVFLHNNGIINDCGEEHIAYYANKDNLHVYFTEHGLIYQVSELDQNKETEREKEKNEHNEIKGIPIKTSTVNMNWVGANPHPLIIPNEKAGGYQTYLKKVDTGYTTITTHGYRTLKYQDVYPGIDVVYTIPDKGGIKYNVIVHPGADPSIIRMRYSGNIEKMEKDNDGNVSISTISGDIKEHSPVCYTDDNKAVASSFSLSDHELKFAINHNYDHSKTLTIDPWVNVMTQLVLRNLGVTVDYDLAGDVFVYGAGSEGVYDLLNYHKVAKYDPNGNFLWVFNGSVPSINWNSAMGAYNFLSNAKVDKATGKIYVGIGLKTSGAQSIRINSLGAYDNFETQLNTNFTELWSFSYDYTTGAMLALGGGPFTHFNMGVINKNTGAIVLSNFTTITGTGTQDVACSTYDDSGNLYVIIASTSTPQIRNTMYRVNSTYNNYVWHSPTGFSTFWEASNLRAFDNFNNGSTNNFNALAANSSYLFYYDGVHLAAYSLANGSMVGTHTVISGYDSLMQGGIAVDDCNNVYVGGQGVIKTFTFNGISFVSSADIPLGAGFTGDTVFDVRYNSFNNLLYATGSQMVGTYMATLSTTCIVDTSIFTSSVISDCDQAIVKVVPGSGLNNQRISFLWEDSAGNILKQTMPGNNLIDTLSGAGTGQYTVHIQLNVNTGGSEQVDSFVIFCDTLVILPNDPIGIPDAFTPNADGKNDSFRILATSVKDFRLRIYDRWGVQVYESTDINDGWDGTYKGTPQPEEVYTFFFSITFLNGKTIASEGSLTLLR